MCVYVYNMCVYIYNYIYVCSIDLCMYIKCLCMLYTYTYSVYREKQGDRDQDRCTMVYVLSWRQHTGHVLGLGFAQSRASRGGARTKGLRIHSDHGGKCGINRAVRLEVSSPRAGSPGSQVGSMSRSCWMSVSTEVVQNKLCHPSFLVRQLNR